LTLVELMIAASVMSLVAVTLGGLVQAVDTARTYVSGMQMACSQGQFAVARIGSAIERAGTYRIGTGQTVAGLAVIRDAERADILVVWTGGREDSLATKSPLNRLPLASELVIFTPDPDVPQRLVEIADPFATGTVDFASPSFATRVRQLISSSTADERVTLCDRVRVARLGAMTAAALRFGAETTPDDGAVATTTPGTNNWRGLPWYGGVSSSKGGLRHVLVRIELQMLTQGKAGDPENQVAMPVFGAASRRYFYERG
jgi:hypothetical protein